MSGALAGRVVRYWKFSIGIWLVLTVSACGIVTGWVNSVGLIPTVIPRWNQIVNDGESVRLPSNMPSARAEDLFNKAFPKDRLASSVVLALHREGSPLTSSDRSFIENDLVPRLSAIQTESGTTIKRVRGFNDPHIGKILDKKTGEATLVMADLEHDFLDQRNKLTVDRVQQLIDPEHGLLRSKVPAGLQISLGGSATVGRDLLTTVEEDAGRLQWWPLLIVLGLALAVYRAPYLALIPIVVVFSSLQITLAVLILLAWAGSSGFDPLTALRPFSGLRTFVSVIVYGAGLNYCLFLIARYRGQLERGNSVDSALTKTLQQLRGMVIASVGTIGCGVGTMLIASFGKYQLVGGAMALSLGITLLCSLTLLPALLKLTGKYVFWPRAIENGVTNPVTARSTSGLWVQSIPTFAERAWERLHLHPTLVWLSVVALMLPFALVGILFHNQTSFELLGDLPHGKPSVEGSRAVEKYFGPGQCGPVTALLYNPQIDFSDPENFEAIESFITNLNDKKQELGIVDIRSLIAPLGLDIEMSILARGIAKRYYISTAAELEDHVMRLELLTAENAFTPASRDQLRHIETYFRETLPESIRPGTELSFLGTTASVVDLKTVTDGDQVVLDSAVLGVMLVVLIGLLRRVATPCYLICSTCFVYFATLGMTTAIFWTLNPDFAGLDWKVPLFLFTILVAIGQDYNVFLTSPMKDDQLDQDPVDEIRTTMLTTGSIISQCGLVTAGAFFSLVLAGQLSGSHQLGVALTLGILLDTTVARRILFPAWLLILNANRVSIRAENPISATPVRLQELSTSHIVL